MTHNDREAFVRLLADAMAFYRQDVSTFAVSVWWAACERFDLAQVRRAFTAHAMNADSGQFAPKPADLIRVLEGTSTDRAAVAWGKALDAAGRVGAYTDVVFDDAAIHAAVEDLGGWPKFCRTEAKDLGYLQLRFCELHKAYTGRGEFDYSRVLPGDRSPDDVYTKRGLPPPRPAVIGDVVRARAVMLGGQQAGKTAISFHDVANRAVGGLLDNGQRSRHAA